MVTFRSRLADRVDEHGEERHFGDDEKHGCKAVGDERDAQWCRPSTGFGDKGSVGVHLEEEHHREDDDGAEDRDAHDPLGGPRPAHEDRDSRADQREHDR